MVRQVGPVETTRTLASAPLAEGQQSTQAAVGRPIGWINQYGGLIDEFETAADHQSDPGRLGGLMRPYDAGDAVPVGNGERLQAADGRLGEQLVATTGAAQKREVGGALQFGIAPRRGPAHPNRPWMNQACEPVVASSSSPARNSQKRSPASSSTWK